MTHLWTRRRLALSLALCVVVVLFAAVVVRTWSSTFRPPAPPTPRPPTHAIYRFHLEGFPSDPLHPGQQLTLRWVPELINPASTALAVNFVCAFGLYGPYTSQADADRLATSLVSRDPAAWPPFTVFPEPSYISDQTAEPQSVVLALPLALHPGIYVAISTAQNTYDLSLDTHYVLLRVVASGVLVS